VSAPDHPVSRQFAVLARAIDQALTTPGRVG
jgi:hypothetical protein